MDRHKSLYKENSSMLSPRQHNKINRQIHNANRAQKRKDIFLDSRRISVSPCGDRKKPVLMCVTSTPAPSTAKKQKVLLSLDKPMQKSQEDNKENANDLVASSSTAVEQLPEKDDQKTSRIAKVACTAVADEHKWSRQEKFLKRFVEWKENKKEQEALRKQQQPKRRPFVASGNSYKTAAVTAPTPSTTSFAPKNHQFKAPDGLKNPLKENPASSAPNGLLRKSFYTVVPTPPRKKPPPPDLKRLPTARKVPPPPLSLKSHAFGSTPSRTPTTTVGPTKKSVAPPAKINSHTPAASAGKNRVINRKTPAAATGNIKNPISSAKAVNGKNTPRGNLNSAAPTTTTITAGKSLRKTAPVAAKADAPKTFVKPRPLILPPPPPPPAKKIPSARVVKPIRGGVGGGAGSSSTAPTSGAIGKAKLLQNKRTEVDPRSLHTKAKLAVNMKAKKTKVPSATKRAQNVNIKFIGKTLLGMPEVAIVAETPTDLANLNPFEAFVTSTKLKSSSLTHQSSEEFPDEVDTISPVEPLDTVAVAITPSLGGRSSSTSAKRVLMKEKENVKKRKTKFNFVRYSELEATMVAAQEDVQKKPEESKERRKVAEKKQMDRNEVTVSELKTAEKAIISKADDPDKTLQKTPTKEESGDRPANYLSPFVSVSRGKVNARKEQEKRNSIYLQRAQELTPEKSKEEALKPDNVQNQTPVEVRRALETVRYFRKQVSDEIVRLHAICDQWDAYKDEHLPHLQETGGEDMINVTVGQTKLLTNKKFKQFSDLIDRCEAGATGTGVECDGSEKTRPITVVDLEGFWSMVGLQVDNVDKRFENLQRWRDNNWIDPEEVVKVNTKKNVNKVKKAKAAAANTVAVKTKPRSALQQMLRKMHAQMRQNNAAEAATGGDDVVILTPNRSKRRSHSSTPTPTSTSSASKRLSSGTPRRISIVVKDRKSRSAAATVVSIPTPSRPNRSSLARKSSQDSPQLVPHVEQLRRSLTNLQKVVDRSDLLKTALIGATADIQQQQQQNHRRKTVVRSDSSITPPSSPLRTMNGRKSILKTPGTAKGKPKSVIFNEELRIKKFKFTVDDEDNRSDDDDKEKLTPAKTEDGPDQRQYILRTRKVHLRPSSEFVIPQ